MRKKYFYKLIYFILLLIFYTSCYGQTDDYMFRSAIKDKDGNLWFSNMGQGVYRYNPSLDKFTHFTKENGLNDNNIVSIFEDKSGKLWFSTEHGVCLYEAN